MDDVLYTGQPAFSRQRGRALLVGAGALAGLMLTLTLCVDPLRTLRDELEAGVPWSTLPLDLLLTCLAAAVLGCCGAWLALVTLATAVEALTGASSARVRAVSPLVVRRAVLACCGLAVGGAGICSPAALAAEPVDLSSDRRPSAASLDLTGLPLPDRVLGAAPRSATPDRDRQAHTAPRSGTGPAFAPPSVVSTAAASRRPSATYVVQDGDSLWSLAASLLPGEGPAEIDAAWRRIHDLNRAAIGREPDLIIPGTTLRLPHRLAVPRADSALGDTSPTHQREDAS